VANLDQSLELLETFLRAYPDDGVARHHVGSIRQKRRERFLDQRAIVTEGVALIVSSSLEE
jgi:hypothetical protein